MRIEEDRKLDFQDVLLKPKRSKLTSRKDVDLTREFKFASNAKWTGVPVIASNMDGVGTFSMAKILQQFKMLTVLRKHYTIDDWTQAMDSGIQSEYVSVCVGTG